MYLCTKIKQLLRKNYLYVYVSISLINFLFLLPVLSVEKTVFLPDAGDQLTGYYPADVGSNVFSSWGVYNFGVPAQHGAGKLLWYVIQLLTGSAWLTQILIYFGSCWIASLAFAFFFINSGLSRNGLPLIFCAIAYGYNWVTFHTLQMHVLWINAATPFILLFGVRIFFGKGRLLLNIIGLAISLTMCSLFMNLPGLGFGVFFLFPPLIARLITLKRRKRGIIKFLIALGWLAITGLLAILVNLPFFHYGLFLWLRHGFLGYVTTSSGGSLTSTDPLTRLFYMPAIMPTRLSPFLTLTSPTLDSPLWPLGIAAPALSIIALFDKRSWQRTFSLSLLALLLALAILINLVLDKLKIVNSLYAMFPALYVLIEAQNYLVFTAPLSALLAMLGLETLTFLLKRRFCWSKTKNLKRFFVHPGVSLTLSIMLVVSSLSAYNFTPLHFDSVYNKELYYGGLGRPVRSQIPEYFTNLVSRLNSKRATEGPFRVLWLPDPVWYTQIFSSEGTPGFLNLNTLNEPQLHHKLLDAFSLFINSSKRANTTNFGATIAPFGYKYIIVVKDIDMLGEPHYVEVDGNPIHPRGSPVIYESFLSRQQDLVLIESKNEYSIYENIAIPSDNYGVFWLEDGSFNNSYIRGTDLTPKSDFGTVHIRSMSPTYSPARYILEVNSSGSTWLIFNQRYNEQWNAEINGSYLQHTVAQGWANAFYIPQSGVHIVRLSFSLQNVYDITWYAAFLAWGMLATLTIFEVFRPKLLFIIIQKMKKMLRTPYE